MDHWDEDSESSWNGLLPETSFWNSFWPTWDWNKESSQVNLQWQLSSKQSYPHLLQILIMRTPYTTCIHAKSVRCRMYSPADAHTHFQLGSTFQPNRNAVATGLSFINTLCTRSERNLPILMENKKNDQITLPKGRIGFSFLDVVDRDEPMY